MSHDIRQLLAQGSLADRVRWIANAWHAGNVRAVALRTRVPLATLYRILDGTTPRQKALVDIADAYGASLDWLARGRGDPPSPPEGEPLPRPTESLRWADLVLSLDLPPTAHKSLLDLPMACQSAAVHWELEKMGRGVWKDVKKGPLTVKVGYPISRAVLEAIRSEYRAWTLLLTDFIEAVGIEKAKRSVIRSEPWLKARFVVEGYFAVLEKRAKEYDDRQAKGLLPEGSPYEGLLDPETPMPAPKAKAKRKRK